MKQKEYSILSEKLKRRFLGMVEKLKKYTKEKYLRDRTASGLMASA
ncbi:MAG: hypothetical protein RI564_03935 [Gracilimonas sp.]|nr:hypothetical protein [Gracilimonas sp.]